MMLRCVTQARAFVKAAMGTGAGDLACTAAFADAVASEAATDAAGAPHRFIVRLSPRAGELQCQALQARSGMTLLPVLTGMKSSCTHDSSNAL